MRALISAFMLALSFAAVAAEAPPEAAPPEPIKEAAPPAPPPPPLPALSVRREQQKSVLLKKWYGEQTVALKSAEGDFIGIWQEDSSGKPLGALLMLHDASQMPDWPAQLQPLRQYLSQHGWATLSISLPEPDPRVLPVRPEAPKLPPPLPEQNTGRDAEVKPADAATEASKKPEDKDKPTPPKEVAEKPADKDSQPPETQVVYNDAKGTLGDGSLPPSAPPKQEVLPSPPAEPLAQARINAALVLLKEKQQLNNSLLGVGLGAARAAYFLVQQKAQASPVRTLLLINPAMQITALPEFNLSQVLTNPKLPVLDISYRNHPAAPDAAAARKAIARKNNLAAFEQHLIQEPEGSDVGEEQINRIVRGFLVKYAKGKPATDEAATE
ncbi:MAG TPA: DUF3530 family protein [Cellvibrionaceae bacterium]